MDYLASAQNVVLRLAEAVKNFEGTAAPLVQVGVGMGSRLRSPDLQAIRYGDARFWEVKFRSRAQVNRDSGEPEFWIAKDVFDDYLRLEQTSGAEVRIALFHAAAWDPSERWLGITVSKLSREGRTEARFAADGVRVQAWVWPARSMDVIDGPDIALPDSAEVFQVDGEESVDPLSFEALADTESVLRDTPDAPLGEMGEALVADPRAGLEVLRHSLGVPRHPWYSVLKVGPGNEVDGALKLLHYGIRVFIVSDRPLELSGTDGVQLEAFRQARLLEWAVVPDLRGVNLWCVDGQDLPAESSTAGQVLAEADEAGGLNLGQFKIVHADHLADVLVTAGAGTGKTETMSERLLFLLATAPAQAYSSSDGSERSAGLRLDEVAFITFTRESAAEMRRRVASSMLLRQRLCRRVAFPVQAWILQLGSAPIDTIHGYARGLLQDIGAAIEIAPDFRVGGMTMELRGLIDRALGPKIAAMYQAHNPDDVPAAHQFAGFAEELWRKLAQTGLSPLSLTGTSDQRVADWGTPPPGLDQEITELLLEAFGEIEREFRSRCLRDQVLPVDELVAGAIAALRRTGGALRRPPRFLFVDEFQDTDAEQMDLLLALRRTVGTRLFMVGDAKQGIYRFRGAQGNAFRELLARFDGSGLPAPRTFGLTRNFRSGSNLLRALNRRFASWGDLGLLDYGTEDHLRDAGAAAAPGSGNVIKVYRFNGRDSELAVMTELVRDWVRNYPNDSIAVLGRRNRDAEDFRAHLRDADIPCELRIGGDFYRSPAVREARVLLEAVLNPRDDAAVLELCETRWFGGLVELTKDPDSGEAGLLSWPERLASFGVGGLLYLDDLAGLKERLRAMAQQLEQRPALAWLAEMSASLSPQVHLLPSEKDDVERTRYARCLDHLLTLLDGAFSDGPVSLYRVLDWLKLKIATDFSEDEPAPSPEGGGRVTALTVHSVKGLEFDRVVVPRTWLRFSYQPGSSVAVVEEGGSPRLLWHWRPKWLEDPGFTNVAPQDQSLWDEDRNERVREETRLLYVAMTRARSELKVLTTARSGAPALPPDRWSDLL